MNQKTDVYYDIIAVDDDKVSFVDDVDGNFDTLEIAKKYLEAHNSNNGDNGIFRIRKITTEFVLE